MSDLSDQDILEFAGFRIDVARRRLTGPDGAEIALKPKVFDTLAYLVAHPGRVLDKHAILDAVWPGVVVEENNLSQAIAALRRALGDSHDAPRFIATVPGRGYQFVAPVRAVGVVEAAAVSSSKPIAAVQATAPLAALTRFVRAYRRSWRRARSAWLIPGALVLTLALLALPRQSLEEAARDPSIAVTPFADMSAEGDQRYFADGIAEQIIDRLSSIDGLRVIGRASSFAAAAENPDPRFVGERLDVPYVLGGGVRKSSDELRISAHLVAVADGAIVWTDTFGREPGDVFEIQDEIAAAVADALSVTLGVGASASRLGGTQNADALDAYMLGLNLGRERGVGADPDRWARSVEALERAVELDPQFGKAWAELAMSYIAAAGLAGTREATAHARASAERAADRAVEVAPDYWDGHLARGWFLLAQRRAPEAGREFERARVLAERAGADVGMLYWMYLSQVGRLEETLAGVEETRQRDPLAPLVMEYAHFLPYMLGRREEAEQEAERDGGLARTFDGQLLGLAWALEDGDADAVSARFARLRESGDELWDRLADAWASPEDARAAIRAYVAQPGRRSYVNLQYAAVMAGHFGDPELAIAILDQATRDGAPGAPSIWLPAMSEARASEGFKDLARTWGLLDLWRESDAWADFCRPMGEDDFECF